jgi:general secretion pathway protein G
MKKLTAGLLFFLIFTFWLSKPFAAEEPLERLVPDGSLGLISFQGLKQSLEKFQGTALFKILQSPELSESTSRFWKEISKGYEEFRSRFVKEMGFEPTELLDIFGGRLTFALVDLDLEELNKKGSQALPEVLILADVSKNRDQLKDLLDSKILPKIKQQDSQTQVTTEKYQNFSLTTLTNKEGEAISYAFLDNTFVVSLKPSLMKKVMSLQSGQGEGKSIADNASYQSVAEAIARDKSEFHVYINMRRVLDLTKKQVLTTGKLSDQQALKFLNYYNLNSLSWSVAVEGAGVKDRFFLQTYPSEKGFWTHMLKDLEGSSITSESMIPADVLYYQSSLINWVQLWHYLLTVLQEAMPPQEYQKFELGLAFLRDGLKLDPEKNLLEYLGDEIVLAVNVKGLDELMAGGRPSPDNYPFLFMLKLKNPAGLQQTLTQIGTLLQLQFKRDKVGDIPIQYLDIPNPNFPIQLNYAFLNNFWALSLSKSMIGEVNHALKGDTALVNTPDYKELKTHFSEEKIIGLVYVNLKDILKLLAPLADKGMASLAQQMKETVPDLNQVKPPELSKIAEALFGMMMVSKTREDGFVSEAYSPVGGFMGLALVGGLIGALSSSTTPKPFPEDDNAEQAKTLADMRILTTAIESYIAEKGVPPETLEELAPKYLSEVPLRDGWGNEFIYEVGEDNQTYSLISLGKDGVEGGEGLNSDIVVENGEFIAGPGAKN